MKLTCGEQLPDFVYDTPFAQNCQFAEQFRQADESVVIYFLRYYGCTLCQLDLQELAAAYPQIRSKCAKLFVVLQSEPEALKKQLAEKPLPFDIICDPKQRLYRQFEIGAAANKAGLADMRTVKKLLRAKLLGLRHGAYEGNELQLPALVIADAHGKIVYVHYAKSAGDISDAGQLLGLLEQVQVSRPA